MYLLDTNVLIAFAYDDHVSHIRVLNWVNAFLIPEHSDSGSGVREEPRVPYGVEDNDEELIYDEATGTRRLTRCKITGHLVVARRPGQRLVTNEEIKRLLEDFP